MKFYLLEIKIFVLRQLACFRQRKFFNVYSDLPVLFRRMLPQSEISKIPHKTSVYRQCLELILNDPSFKFMSLESHCRQEQSATEGKNFLLRHDHDGGLIAPLAALCDIEESLSLRSSIHVMVDGILYSPEKLVGFWRELNDRGFDVGLHTQTWMKQNYESEFKKEIKKFEDLLGFSPKTFTHHGAWPRTVEDMKRRAEFVSRVNKIILGTPIVGYNNSFDWVFEDSARNGEFQPLLSGFLEVTKRAYPGTTGLILTHDGYEGKSYWH